MRSTFFQGIFLLLIGSSAYAQEQSPALKRSSMYLEILGNAVGISGNYDYLFFK